MSRSRLRFWSGAMARVVKNMKFSKKSAQAFLANTEGALRFFACDGSVYASLSELKRGLETMGEEIFSYHSNDEKSDFKSWIGEVVHDEKLARDVWNARHNRGATLKKVQARIAQISKIV